MASGGGINLVRYYFYGGFRLSPERKKALVALAYATARDQKLAPKAILIRSDIHETTSINGQRTKDPLGWHVTMAFKDGDQVERMFHVASHGYTNGKEDFVLKTATHTPEKTDATPRGGKRSGKVVWPAEELLEEYEDSPIAYSHLPEKD
ncbi:hypothetical protein BO94DRAFT_533310 [Aspergillus sclerotioniger CBS 115572]|uniref:Uncharacterized protein n=1 Tax=Aspergillus sclerotioniger CBS 115572 TaxID=1450535 RepID=A0A317WZQ2_9EURO|nr:hypothetical protein BO94DRAFT_533310 [Aspergillus sclerotioniger CBS 115572]PWY91864.1 hypothetical protein BO94DRAFT_533310 [Aspergillus sclerotioniger CBS 115572]